MNSYIPFVDRLEKRFGNKLFAFVIILLLLLLISFLLSWVLSTLPAWNGNIDSWDKFLNIPFWKIPVAAGRLFLALFFVAIFWCVTLPFWKEHPVERDRSLFTRSGKGLAVYSLGAILWVVSVLMAFTNIVKADTVFPPNAELRSDYPREFGIIKRSWDVICQFADPGNIHNSTNLQGNIIALLSALAGILCLSGLAVSALVSMIARRTQQWKKGLLRYDKGFDKYVVIIGCNEQTMTIAKNCLSRKDVKYVLIQTRKDVEKARQRLELDLDRTDEERIVFYSGERTSLEDIKELRLEKAIEVYILGEDMHSENELDHDAYNMNCLENIHKYQAISEKTERVGKKQSKLRCHVNFEYQSTFMAFKFTHIYRSLNEKIEFIPFNVHEIWAKKIWVDNYALIPVGKHGEKKIIHYLPLDAYWVKREGTSHWDIKYINEEAKQAVHIVIVGMNQMGVALGMQAALLAHFPNFAKSKDRSLRTTITFIDENAGKEGEFLRGRYDALFSLCPYRSIEGKNTELKRGENNRLDFVKEWSKPEVGHFAHQYPDFMDLQWEFVEDNIASPKTRAYLSALAENIEHRTVTIAVCLNNPQQSMATALYLPEIVLKRSLQILVYQQNSYEMIDKVSTSEKEWKRYERLKPFGIIEGSYYGGALDNQLAEFTNLVYDYLCHDNKDELSKVVSDFDTKRFRAKRLWDELGIVYKLANINLADSIAMKCRSISNFEKDIPTLEHDEQKLKYVALAEHNRWIIERLTMGYRPLYKDELEKMKDNSLVYNKEYFKNKSRAHVDICSISELKEWDRKTYERNTDFEMVSRMDDLLQWEQMSYMRDFYTKTGDFQDDIIGGIVKDMCEVSDFLWMSKGLVTKRQWYHVMGAENKDEERFSDEPMVNVTKEDVEEFLLLLNDITMLKFRLPTENEWMDAYKNKDYYLEDMEGKVWQWTMSRDKDYNSSYVLCGRSKKFMEDNWGKAQSYKLPNFKSHDLGFRLVLPNHFHINAISNSKLDYNNEDDDRHVIEELIKYMVRVEDKQGIIEPFYIQQTPLTQRQWKAIKGDAMDNPSEQKGDYYPVENVSFNEAQKFVTELNMKMETFFELPTYEQWVVAVNSDKTDVERILYNGITKSTRRVVWPPKKDTIHDMYGNVWEWCTNSSDGEQPLSSGNSGLVRVMMGGSWKFTKEECLKTEGSYWTPDYKASDVGFRLVIGEDKYKKLMTTISNE